MSAANGLSEASICASAAGADDVMVMLPVQFFRQLQAGELIGPAEPDNDVGLTEDRQVATIAVIVTMAATVGHAHPNAPLTS